MEWVTVYALSSLLNTLAILWVAEHTYATPWIYVILGIGVAMSVVLFIDELFRRKW